MDEIETLREELKLTQQALLLATQVNRYKTGFIGLIAHELRSHLSSLLCLHQVIMADLCESHLEEREFINQAYIAGRNLLQVIEDIITVSKLEYGAVSLKMEYLSITEFLQDLYHFIYLPIKNKHIRLNLIFPKEDRSLYADSKRLLTAMITLIETAINYVNTGVIKISVAEEMRGATVIELSLPITEKNWCQQTSFPSLSCNFTQEELEKFSSEIGLSPGLKIELVKNILATMAGELDISQSDTSTLIKFVLPPGPETPSAS